MSKLGYVYKLHQTFQNGVWTKYKQKYPVVYENKSLYYCKVYGTDELLKLYKDENISIFYHVFTLDEYLAQKDNIFNTPVWEGDNRFCYVFVNSYKEYDFPEFNKLDDIDIEIMQQEKIVTGLELKLKNTKYAIKCKKDALTELEDSIVPQEIELNNQKKKLEELRKKKVDIS